MQSRRKISLFVVLILLMQGALAGASPFLALTPDNTPVPHPDGVEERLYAIADTEQKIKPASVMLPASMVAYEAANYYVWVKKGRTCVIPEGSLIVVDNHSSSYISGYVFHPRGTAPSKLNCTSGSYLYMDLSTTVDREGRAVSTVYYGQIIRAALNPKKN